jgi:hypothetical protein
MQLCYVSLDGLVPSIFFSARSSQSRYLCRISVRGPIATSYALDDLGSGSYNVSNGLGSSQQVGN